MQAERRSFAERLIYFPTLRVLTVFLILSLCSPALAQQCTVEVEPNDTPAQATTLTGEGQDAVAAAAAGRLGSNCLTGELGSNDQDLFLWVVDEVASAHEWAIELEGPDGGLTRVELIDVAFADNGVDVVRADPLFGFETTDGRAATSEPFLMAPGRYVIGLAGAGVDGRYVVNLRPVALTVGSRLYRSGTAVSGAFAQHVPLDGEFSLPFSLSEDASDHVWAFTFQAPLGTSPTLTLEGPTGEIDVLTPSDHRPVRLANIGLLPGDYVAHVTPGAQGGGGHVALRLERLGRKSDGVEVEPNDRREDATLFPLGGEMRGAADGTDYFRVEVGADDAGSAWDLSLEAAEDVWLRIYSPGGDLVQERRGVSGSSPGLHVDAGGYFIVVTGSGGGDYSLSFRPGETAADGHECEPNDLVSGATPLGPEMQARGELRTQDIDFYRIDVEGEAQSFRFQVVVEGEAELGVYDAGGNRQAIATGERRIRLDDVVLMPGPAYVGVSGSEGEYALRALSLGPAPEPTAPEDAPAADEPIVSAPKPTAEESVETGAELPGLPPPPPGILEREPNDDNTRAHGLQPGVVHVGRLSVPDDEDLYRFHLATSQYVRVELVPAEGETEWVFAVDGRRHSARADPKGERVVAERWMLAGDHEVALRASWLPQTPTGYYQLRVIPLGSLGLPVDLEPNDTPESASRLPSELRWTGHVGDANDRDIYLLPVFAVDTVVTLVVTAGDRVTYDVLNEGRARLETADDGSLFQTIPSGEHTYLRFSGFGDYQAALEFSTPPDPAALLPPREGGELEATLEFSTPEAAAFWHAGQSVDGILNLTNVGAGPVTVSLEGAATVFGASLDLPESAAVAAGETVAVPLTVRLPADLPDQEPVAVQVAATGGSSASVAAAEIALRCEATPVSPFPHWPVPEPLLGRPNVLFAGFGAATPAGADANSRDQYANDGRTTVSNGGWVGVGHAATFRLAGTDEAPVTLLGTVINPSSNANVDQQLWRFRIETSMDGERFESVLEADLPAARADHAFVFERPVSARYARLVGVESRGGQEEGYFGEWKLIADDPALLSGRDLADPTVGGHVVWTSPLLDAEDYQDVLTGEGSVGRLDLGVQADYSVVIGFQNSRAALVSALALTQPDDDPAVLFGPFEVHVSLAGAAGPWRLVAKAELGGPSAVTEVTLDEATWARYVKLTFPKVGDARYFQSPRAVQVFETEVGDGYLSALAEWGTDTTHGPYEVLMADTEGLTTEPEDAGATPAEAAPLASGQTVTGTVAVAEDVDWYRITVPEGENHLEVRLSGDPAIEYVYELTDTEGSPVAAQVTNEGDDVHLSALVEPGDYLLRLEEPKRTVVFAWDTSVSVAPYRAIIYNSLASFARDVDGEREAVQLLAFGDPDPKWLLPYWSTDTERVQRAIAEWDREAQSSSSFLALLTATEALGNREGAKAVLLITDAQTSEHHRIPQLWSALEEVRPRVFTFEVSSGGGAYQQQLMQNWASVNAGVYEMASGVGDFEAGFARASCLMRRPKRYTVAVTTATVEPPGPGTLTVLPSDSAGNGAIHVIFDASGSMGQALPSGEQRIVAAKRALEDLVGVALEEGTPFSLRAFGHVAPNSCETSLDVELAPLEREEALAAVRAIEPKLLSQTAIADSLELAANDLSGASGPRTVILITDGEESCGGDPAAAAAELRAAGDATITIVSLALDADSLAVFEGLAEDIGATYVDVGSFEALQEAIAAALKPSFEVYDVSGALVATGRVGDSVELPMGVYSVRVLTSPAQVFESVTVPGDGQVQVQVVAGAR